MLGGEAADGGRPAPSTGRGRQVLPTSTVAALEESQGMPIRAAGSLLRRADACLSFMHADPDFPIVFVYIAIGAVPVTLHELGHAVPARVRLGGEVQVSYGGGARTGSRRNGLGHLLDAGRRLACSPLDTHGRCRPGRPTGGSSSFARHGALTPTGPPSSPWWMNADGSDQEPLTAASDGVREAPGSFSPDGRRFAFTRTVLRPPDDERRHNDLPVPDG